MKKATCKYFFLLWIAVVPTLADAAIFAGVGKADITPVKGTPSAGYADRKGEGMEGVHDPLLAIALFLDNEEKKIVLCSVDHLGFTYDMVQEISKKVHAHKDLTSCEIYIASSHTHSGGGAYLNIPIVGSMLAGAYSEETTRFYVDKTTEAILKAYEQRIPAKVGIGYGYADKISTYRASFPIDVSPLNDVTLIKVVGTDDTPITALFNFPVHPTILNGQNRLFSADFVGYARDQLQTRIGSSVQPMYFNGAQGDIAPVIFDTENRYKGCELLAQSLVKTVTGIWETTRVSDHLDIATQHLSYAFEPVTTPFGLKLPVDLYKSEMNLIVLNKTHAFLTIPGELSCLYDRQLKEEGLKLGFSHVSIFGLTNDAHGYIITPGAWQHKTMESGLSFGGENYGALTASRAQILLKSQAPN